MCEVNNLIRCGIVLAGGEGQRLRPFVRRFRTDDLPKQYIKFIGGPTHIEQNIHIAERTHISLFHTLQHPRARHA